MIDALSRVETSVPYDTPGSEKIHKRTEFF